MTPEELDECADAVLRRIQAAIGNDDPQGMAVQVGDAQYAMFAGTDLPGREVLGMLASDACANRHHLTTSPAVLVLKALAVNGFWLGYECGRRG